MQMTREKHQTKIICSLDSVGLKPDYAKDFSDRTDIAALRILYDPRNTKKILEFIPLVEEFRSPELNKIPIMIDVGSFPRASVANVKLEEDLQYAQILNISKIGKGGDIEINTEDWQSLFAENESVFFGFGSIECRVLEIGKEQAKVKVLKGGGLVAGTAVHVPATRKAPSIFDLSYIDIKPFQELGVDYVVLPGVNSAREIAVVRKKLDNDRSKCPWLLIRVDHLDVYEKVNDLLDEADGVLISRRDLALTMEAATVPMVCKEVIRECNKKAKLAIIASDILGSLQFNPTPTRAEVSDIANSVMDGTDAIVLSEEVAHGKHLMRGLSLCQSIILDVEEQQTEADINWKKEELAIHNELDAVSFHAYKTAQRVKAKAIVCLTKEGNTALRLASFRTSVPVIAVTFSEEVKSRLSLVRGVYSMVLDIAPHLDEVLPVVNKQLKREGWLRSGDKIVFVTVTLSSVGREASNLFTIQSVDRLK